METLPLMSPSSKGYFVPIRIIAFITMFLCFVSTSLLSYALFALPHTPLTPSLSFSSPKIFHFNIIMFLCFVSISFDSFALFILRPSDPFDSLPFIIYYLLFTFYLTMSQRLGLTFKGPLCALPFVLLLLFLPFAMF